jgi:hypothetical protein
MKYNNDALVCASNSMQFPYSDNLAMFGYQSRMTGVEVKLSRGTSALFYLNGVSTTTMGSIPNEGKEPAGKVKLNS